MFNPEGVGIHFRRTTSAGVALVELLVGLAIAAVAIGAAMASLRVASGAAVTVSELAQLHQDASHAMRVLGQQTRMVGSNELQASATGRFRFVVGEAASESSTSVHGEDGSVGSSDSVRLIHTSPPLLLSQQVDCLGQGVAPGLPVEATFQVDSRGNLQCKGTAPKAQPLISGVATFKLRYRVRQGNQVRSLLAAEVEAAGLWRAVTALESCLELQGGARSAAAEAIYTDCEDRSIGTGGRLKLVRRKLFVVNAQASA